MSRLLISLASILALSYLGLCLLLMAKQRAFIYYPTPGTPAAGSGLLRLPSAAGDVLVSQRDQPGKHALLYFSGNAEDSAANLPALAATFPEYALYLMHYRGYSGSAGQASEQALFADALALYDLVRRDHPQITVIGRSLGSGVAAYLASQRPVERLVLVTPFDSILALAKAQFPYLPVSLLLRERYESTRYAKTIHTPTLLLVAEHDSLIPLPHSQALLAQFPPGVASMISVPDTDHNDIGAHPDYLKRLRGPP